MTNISLADITIHIDEIMDDEKRAKVENNLRSIDGVISVQSSKETPHLFIVKYDPDHARSKEILDIVLGEHLHAELLGL